MPYLIVNNINMYYEVHGQGEPLLFIHGLGSSVRDWENQVDFFSRHYHVITVDLRGHGKTDKPNAHYTIPLFSQDIAQLIQALKIERVHVVGHSLGGMVAFALALDFPELIQTLTIVNSGPAVIFPSFKSYLTFYLRSVIIKLFGIRLLSLTLANKLFPKPEQEALRKKFIKRWCENDPKAYLNALHAFPGWSVMNRLPELACPTLIVTADNDYTPVLFKESYAKLIENAQIVVIKDSWHMTIVDQAINFNNALLDFLQGNTQANIVRSPH